jgi:hypothetical protein
MRGFLIKRQKNALQFLCFGFLLFAFPVYAGIGDVPQIKDDRIIFYNGKIILYQPKRILFSNPEEAAKKAKPVSISEDPKLIQRWNRLIMVRTLNYYEGVEKEVTVYDYAGNRLSSSQKNEGEVFFIEGSNRIFLAGQSFHNRVNKSLLLDQNGNLVREVSQPENVLDFGFSRDSEIIWVISSSGRDGIPTGQIKVIDSNGDEIKNIEFLKAMEIEVSYKGKIYKINVPQPDFPG